ncbi:MAG: abortive phage infection protein [Clostridium sp.]|nr:abortive phage infection protein [Clostridium sp.]
MNYQDKLEKLIETKDGLILTREVEAAGISRQYLNILLKEKKLERVAHGVYLTPDAFDDEMYRIQAKNQRIIFSHETALYLHDLTDRDPIEWSVTIPYGYNATHLRDEGIKVYTVKKTLHQMGVIELKTIYGRDIKAYNKERTICDIVRNRNNMDVGILNEAVKRYLSSKDKNIPLLMRYAEELDIQNILRNYVEILL